jgi:hypothetical protein
MSSQVCLVTSELLLEINSIFYLNVLCLSILWMHSFVFIITAVQLVDKDFKKNNRTKIK